jgi:hypothetical protein
VPQCEGYFHHGIKSLDIKANHNLTMEFIMHPQNHEKNEARPDLNDERLKNNPWLNTDNDSDRPSSGKSIFDFTFPEGETKWRILPAQPYPWFNFESHWVPVVTSAMTIKKVPVYHLPGVDCLLCSAIAYRWKQYSELKETKWDKNKDHPEAKAFREKFINDFKAKMGHDLCIIVEGQIGKVFRLTVGEGIWKALNGFGRNASWGSPSDPENGYWLSTTKTGSGITTEYETVPLPPKSPLTDAQKALKMLDLSSLRQMSTTEEVLKILKKVPLVISDAIRMVNPDTFKETHPEAQEEPSEKSPEENDELIIDTSSR